MIDSEGGNQLWNDTRNCARWPINGPGDRAGFVDGDAPLRLGDYRCTAAELGRAAREVVPSEGAAAAQPGDRYESLRQRLRGRVERDAATGEIVRRRP